MRGSSESIPLQSHQVCHAESALPMAAPQVAITVTGRPNRDATRCLMRGLAAGPPVSARGPWWFAIHAHVILTPEQLAEIHAAMNANARDEGPPPDDAKT
jgi:hypothetical protein